MDQAGKFYTDEPQGGRRSCILVQFRFQQYIPTIVDTHQFKNIELRGHDTVTLVRSLSGLRENSLGMFCTGCAPMKINDLSCVAMGACTPRQGRLRMQRALEAPLAPEVLTPQEMVLKPLPIERLLVRKIIKLG
eukprot:5357414-Amphidinium_carterae.1